MITCKVIIVVIIIQCSPLQTQFEQHGTIHILRACPEPRDCCADITDSGIYRPFCQGKFVIQHFFFNADVYRLNCFPILVFG